MKILVLGAGVLGCTLAMNLFAAGKDVTLLARGDWYRQLKEHGLTIRYRFSPKRKTAHIPVIDRLHPDDVYDVIFVVLRYTQLNSIMPTLAENASPRIVFVGNNTRCDSYASQLPGKQVMYAFTLSAGHRAWDHVSAIDLKRITIGQLKTSPSHEPLIREIFRNTAYRVNYEPNMGDYLLSHACFVTPAAFACYAADGNLKNLRGDKAKIHLAVNAIMEGFSALEKAGHQILPGSMRYRSRRFRSMVILFFKVMCATELGQVCAADHAMAATEEMSALNDDLKQIFARAEATCPSWAAMEKCAAGYIPSAGTEPPGQ